MDFTEEFADIALKVLDDRIAGQKELVVGLWVDLDITRGLIADGQGSQIPPDYAASLEDRYQKATASLERFEARKKEIEDAKAKGESQRDAAIVKALRRETVDAAAASPTSNGARAGAT